MNKPVYSDEWVFDLAASECVPKAAGNFLSPGRRNNDIASIAGFLFRKGLDVEDVERKLLAINGDSTAPLRDAEIYRTVRSIARYQTVGIKNFDDVTISREFAIYLEGTVCYTIGLGWLSYQDGRWRQTSETEIQELAKSYVESLVAGVQSNADADSNCLKAAKRYLTKAKIRAILDLVRSDPRILRKTDEFDAKRDVLNVTNGTIEFDDSGYVFREHRPEDLLTQIADVNYDGAAVCPTFDRVLARALPSELAGFFLRYMGYVLSGRFDQQVFGIVHGPGANGKSTLVNEIQACLGSYALNVETSTFMVQNNAGIRNDIARIRGARLAVSSELGLGQALDAPLMKKWTGGDRITARFLYGENFEFTPSAVPLFVTNALPIIDGGDAAMLRRIVIIGFTTVIPEEERDPLLPEKLRAERSGILNRLLEGMMDYLSNGALRPPASVAAATAEYGTSSDLLGLFLADRTVASPTALVGASVFYNEYRTWCMTNGLRSLSAPQFKNAMLRRQGISNKRDKSGWWWHGLHLRNELEP